MSDSTHSQSVDSVDEAWMRVALNAARLGHGYVEPNPMVGCVIARDGELIGQGHHERFGGPHAEIMALRSLGSLDQARGATAYVTLEPCCHHGKTPPCADALIEAGIARVVVAMKDPFPKVDGGGLDRLSDAGIETTLGILADEASEIVAPFVKQVRTGKPWVIAKWAMTIDGKIATTIGESQWITGKESRAEVHRLRGRVDAVLAGMGTVIADDPMLTARPPGPRPQIRGVFCRSRLPDVKSKLIRTATDSPVRLFVSDLIAAEQVDCQRGSGAAVVMLGTHNRTEMIQKAIHHLGCDMMTNVMVEGGGELLGSFFEADEVDECHVYIGAKLFGGNAAPGPIGGDGVAALADASVWVRQGVDSFGDDVRIMYRKR
ncbi:bifunctional diaminohydroxyphosphoribosylaminopyrimidine deaminase/5-amino-6-(5-phosphoribosylamino)uracil reductase RibD [Planctomycetes bacterium K23_9]|uniref:Riboflavin biosynthesis protein RibD n=1 Tax=Stieleria marina TaxID=1930275 RepID=A0A517NQA1_9BACT|nr:Riboflavin biosynthesis protein RibD [Planctomycetes bacterium K23_9]